MKKSIYILVFLYSLKIEAQNPFFVRDTTKVSFFKSPIEIKNKYYAISSKDYFFGLESYDNMGKYQGYKLIDTARNPITPGPEFASNSISISFKTILANIFIPMRVGYPYPYRWLYTPCMVKIDTNGLQAVYHYSFANPTSFDFYDYSPESYIYAQGETNRDTLNNQYLSSDCVVMKIDTAGNEVWRYTINSSSYANRPGGIVATPDSGCLLVYYYGPWPAYSVARALKLDKNGGLQWVKNIPLNTNGLYSINLADYDAQQEILYLRYNPYSYLYQLPSMIAKLDKNMNKIWDIRMGIYDSVKIKDPLSANVTDSVYDYKVIDYLGYGRIKPNGFLGIGRKAVFPEINSDYLQMMNDSGRVLWEAHYDGMYQGTKRVWGGYHFSGYNTTSDGGYILTGSCRDTLGNQVGFLMKIDSLGCLTADSCETRFISSIRYYDQPATSLSIYPNPASDRLNINLQGFGNLEGLEISFYNLLGQKTHQQKITQTETNLSVSQWQRGIYFYELSNSKGRVASGKICIE